MQTSLTHFKSRNSSFSNREIEERLKELYGEDHKRDTILYCEDDEMLRRLMTELLSEICVNKKVFAIDSADLAIEILKNNIEFRKKIAFVISDFNMPPGRKTGGDLAMYLRAKLKDHKTPFILNSADSSIDQRTYLGVIDGFAEKPLRIPNIAPSIIKAVKARILSRLN